MFAGGKHCLEQHTAALPGAVNTADDVDTVDAERANRTDRTAPAATDDKACVKTTL